MTTKHPPDDHMSDYHKTLVAKVPDGDLLELLQNQIETYGQFVSSIPNEQSSVVHPPYGWSVRQVIEHVVDAERVFGYRMLRFANGDSTELPGWDENTYAANDYGDNADLNQLANELISVRQANLALLNRLKPALWDTVGTADGRPFSVRTIAFLMAGHLIHHQQILEKRLSQNPA